MISFWEVVDRAVNTGPLMRVNEFEKKLFQKVVQCVKKYEIRYTPETPIVDDPDLISRLFEAGIELYRDIGTFCLNTGRVIRFDETEIRQALRELALAPAEITVGEGFEKIRL